MDWLKWFQWLVIIPPWIVLIFLNKDKLKRFIPTMLLCMVILGIVYQLSINLNWFEYKPTLIFLEHNSPLIYGGYAIGTLLLFYFLYGRFWIFIIVDSVMNLIQSFVLVPYMEKLGLFERGKLSAFEGIMQMIVIALILYCFQMWMDDDRYI